MRHLSLHASSSSCAFPFQPETKQCFPCFQCCFPEFMGTGTCAARSTWCSPFCSNGEKQQQGEGVDEQRLERRLSRTGVTSDERLDARSRRQQISRHSSHSPSTLDSASTSPVHISTPTCLLLPLRIISPLAGYFLSTLTRFEYWFLCICKRVQSHTHSVFLSILHSYLKSICSLVNRRYKLIWRSSLHLTLVNMTNEVSTPQTDINSNDTNVSEPSMLIKVPELDQGFVETDSVCTPSSSNTDFDSADDESVVSYCSHICCYCIIKSATKRISSLIEHIESTR